jgi:20S proteasome subunit beta 6
MIYSRPFNLCNKFFRYQHKQGVTMPCSAVAQLLSVTLYYRRFFPYYAFCMVGGVDEEGKGAVYGYDAVGSYKRDDYGCMGSGQNFIMPLLDNLVRFHDYLVLTLFY